ncbi:hypothetical protein ACFTQ7_19330 [Lysinibacillus sp. NPDC056959]|uniref:hypothetical protein n=1 Tax=Lysinibacillus sp. NPDC056959 TaxID=3345981 RepID=UPI003631F1D2
MKKQLLFIEGKLASYSLHLGSGRIMSKLLLLSEETKIKDSAILGHIYNYEQAQKGRDDC